MDYTFTIKLCILNFFDETAKNTIFKFSINQKKFKINLI